MASSSSAPKAAPLPSGGGAGGESAGEIAQLTRVCELWETATERAERQYGMESEKLMMPLLKAAEVRCICTLTR